jgi:ATP-dependent DNA helicase RecQ
MSPTDHAIDLERTLHERFGLERFRPGQREVIENVLQGRDVLCVMPTGGGKSLCYQLPALLLPGLALVVSPLIALMKDQVDALTQRGIRATLLNSTLDPTEQLARIREIEAGHYDLVYVAPERFRSPRFIEAMARVRPVLLAVDEAHCISEWGHDFRPDYARIGLARRKLGSPACIALTATATDLVRRDIADQLDLRDPAQFVTGFDRPNLTYAVNEARRDAEKLAAVAEALERNPGPAIIYASSRARCEMIGQHLTHELRRSAVVYHAGMTREERTAAQERFMSGTAEIVVATNAFGMGIDKADIRSVIHFNMPGTLEAYYQEAGRAGRDGRPAHCLLIFAFGDRKLQELFIENEYPPAPMVYRVYEFLRAQEADPIELTQAEIKEAAGVELSESAVGSALKLLESAGAIEKFLPRENMAIIRINADEGEPSMVDRLGPQANVQRIVVIGLEGLINRRFGEPIYFHPDEFASTLGLERTALNRALKALVTDLPIDYVPPFRGNAIRVIDRTRRARQIEIDFASLEKRKQREYDKLERMIRYCQTNQCRRSFLLGYFGDNQAAQVHCRHCDNCGRRDGQPGAPPASMIDTPAGREVILKALSGVARAKGRFGKTLVAQMLTGSGAEKVDRWGLRKLSTFGILSDFRQPEVVQILDALGAAGYLECPEVDRFRPVVQLTEEGWELIRSHAEKPLGLVFPDELARKVRNGGLDRIVARTAPHVEDDEEDESNSEPSPLEADPLWNRLKSLRAQWAREAKQPAYCIFSNQTLDDLARSRPRTPQALAGIKGLGPARLERYGTALLEAIAQAPEAPNTIGDNPSGFRHSSLAPSREVVSTEALERPRAVASPAPSASPRSDRPPTGSDGSDARPSTASYVPTEEWTWRLLDRGFTIDEAAAIRGLEPSIVIRHVTWMARQGRRVALERFLDAETIARWEAWRAEHGDAAPPPESPSAALWPLYLVCRA